MPVKYSVDLRWRAVWLHLICGKLRSQVADVLFMSKRSVDRYITLYGTTGSVNAAKQRHGPQCVLTDLEQLTILQSLLNKPTMYTRAAKRAL